MTYSVGGSIQASDYNGFVGTTAVNVAYTSSVAATNKIAALMGVGYGDRGYGQTGITLASVAATDIVTAAQWNNLQSAMSVMNTHQGSGLTLQPTVSAGGTILAENGTLSRPNISTLISSLDSNRLTASVTDMQVTLALTSSQTTPWTHIIKHVFTVTFGGTNNPDYARWFFNSGGQVRFSGANTGGTTTASQAWAHLLRTMGTISFGAYSTTYTGSGGTVNNIGYYNLTTSPTVIFTHTGAGGTYYPHYSGILYSIAIQTNATGTANGSNGYQLTCTVTFNDSGATYAYGSVNGTTTSTINYYKASNSGSLSITAPTFTTTTPL